MLTIPVEIMLRGNNHVFTDTLTYPTGADAWMSADAGAVVKGILLAIYRAQDPDQPEVPDVGFRGVNWIVHPGAGGAVIALEIHSASAVAGPIPIDTGALEALLGEAMRPATGVAAVQ